MSGRVRWTIRERVLSLWEGLYPDSQCGIPGNRFHARFVAVEPLPQGRLVTLSLAVQFASKAKHLPDRAQVRRWALAAHGAHGYRGDAVITIRYVDAREGRALNLAFRKKDYATNVLTFVHDEPAEGMDIGCASRTKSFNSTSSRGDKAMVRGAHPMKNYSADIVICAPVIAREAREQKKPVAAHHGHMVIHGMLHAQGFDHEVEADASAMENIEIAVLKRFRIKNPYEIE